MNIDVLAIIIGAFILVCILICYSCAKVSGNCSDQERKDELFQIVYQKGYDAGYLAGDRDGYSAGIRRMSVMRKERVDVAPGPDSIRPDAKTTCPVVTSYDISNAQIRHIFDAEPAQEVPHD